MTINRTVPPVALIMFQHSAKTFEIPVVADDGNPVDLSGMTLRFVAHDASVPPVAQFEVEDAGITPGGTGNSIASVEVTPAASDSAADNWHWELWNVTDAGSEAVLAHGSLAIRPAVKDIA